MFLMPENKWAGLWAYVTGLVNQKRLIQNEYLAAENRILRAQLPARIRAALLMPTSPKFGLSFGQKFVHPDLPPTHCLPILRGRARGGSKPSCRLRRGEAAPAICLPPPSRESSLKR